MKTNFTVSAASGAACLALVLGNLVPTSARDEVREEFKKNCPLKAGGKVSLENVNGRVHITTWDRDEVKIEAVKRADRREQLEKIQIQVEEKSDHVRIKTKLPDSKWSLFGKNSRSSVDYEVTVPREANLSKIGSVNGAVEIEGAGGSVEASTVNGRLAASGLAGDARLSTVNGAIRAAFAQVPRDKKISVSTVNGSLSIHLPPNANAEVRADTVNGSIRSDFASLAVKKNFPVGRDVKGRIGEGGASIKLSTVNGAIRIQSEQAVVLGK